MCPCRCVKEFVPAAGPEQRLWWLICSGARTSRDWLSRARCWRQWLPKPSCWRDPYCIYINTHYILPTNRPYSSAANKGSRMWSLLLFMFAKVLSVSNCLAGHVYNVYYIYIYIQVAYVWICAHQHASAGTQPSLTAVWTQQHGTAAASTWLGCWIQPPHKIWKFPKKGVFHHRQINIYLEIKGHDRTGNSPPAAVVVMLSQ